jgi:hypothetical protein
VEREAKEKAEHDQQAEMEAKTKADQEVQEPLPPPPFKPLAEQSFMQYMQFMLETQNKLMQELLGQVGAGRVPEARGLSRQKKAKIKAKRFQPIQTTSNLSSKPGIKSEGSSTNWEISTPRDKIICHNCGLPGHMKRDCVKPRVVCHTCGKEGPIRPDCPRKPLGGWPVKGKARPGAGGRPSSGGGNNGKNNNGKRGRTFGKLNCTTLEEANNLEAAVIGTLNNLICPVNFFLIPAPLHSLFPSLLLTILG